MSALCDAATVVIRGDVVSERVEEVQLTPIQGGTEEQDPLAGAPEQAAPADTPTVVKTIATVTVTDVLAGAGLAVGDQVEVGQLGGSYEGVEYEAQRFALAADDPYVMFLVTYPDSPTNFLNPTQGGYQISDQNTLVADQSNTLARAAEPLVADATLCAGS